MGGAARKGNHGRRRHNPGRRIADVGAVAQHLCYDMTVKPGLRDDCECDEQWTRDEKQYGVKPYRGGVLQ